MTKSLMETNWSIRSGTSQQLQNTAVKPMKNPQGIRDANKCSARAECIRENVFFLSLSQTRPRRH